MNELIESIKQHEGFKGKVYIDSEGYETIGYGTKLPITKEEAELLLRHRLNNMMQELKDNKPFFTSLDPEAQEILFEMAYNLGVSGLLKFTNMWKALEEEDYIEASKEMVNSKWYHQVGIRAKHLVNKMKGVSK